MGRGSNTSTDSGISLRGAASIAKAWPMNEILETIAENLVDVDGGLECPYGDGFYTPAGGEMPEHLLIAECPQHGVFHIDVDAEYEQILSDLLYD